MTDLYSYSTAMPAHVRMTMGSARTMIHLRAAQIIMDVHSPHVSASECQNPSKAGLGFRAVCLAFHLAVNRAHRLMTFPPEYALFVASCVIITLKLYDPMRKTMCEFGTSPAAQRTGGEAGKTISRWGAASQSVQ